MNHRVLGIDASRANRSVRTGVEQYAYHVIQELKHIVPDDVRVVLYSEEPLRDGLDVLPKNWESRVLGWPPRRLWTQVRLAWEMLVRPPDLLFVPAHVPPLFMLRARLVTTLHDVAFMTMPEAYSPHGRLFLWFTYQIAAWRGRVLTVSEFSKKEIVRLFHVEPSRVTATPLAHDAALYRPGGAEAAKVVAARHGVTKPYFLFVGRLERKKNLSGLMRAFGEYARMRPEDDVELVLVGKPGFGYAAEKKLAIDAGVPMGRVRELGFVPNKDMPALFTGASAFVFPSHYEGFGIPLLEAMACGAPVITSRTTALPEVAGEAAVYVRDNDVRDIAGAMKLVVDDVAARERLRDAGLRRAAEFSWAKTAERTWEVLREGK